MSKISDLKKLVENLYSIKCEYSLLAFDEESWMKLGKPASKSRIDALEKRIGYALPKSYRTFLQLHDGWEHFDGGLNILSIADQGEKWVKDWLKMLEVGFTSIDAENPFKKGALPIVLGEGEHSFLYMDPRTIKSNGEMDFVMNTLGEEDNRYSDFISYLRNDLETEQELLNNEKKGMPDEDD